MTWVLISSSRSRWSSLMTKDSVIGKWFITISERFVLRCHPPLSGSDSHSCLQCGTAEDWPRSVKPGHYSLPCYVEILLDKGHLIYNQNSVTSYSDSPLSVLRNHQQVINCPFLYVKRKSPSRILKPFSCSPALKKPFYFSEVAWTKTAIVIKLLYSLCATWVDFSAKTANQQFKISFISTWWAG